MNTIYYYCCLCTVVVYSVPHKLYFDIITVDTVELNILILVTGGALLMRVATDDRESSLHLLDDHARPKPVNY